MRGPTRRSRGRCAGGGCGRRARRARRRGRRPEFAVIDHPAGEETQWDWVELPDPPPSWGQGRQAHLLVGALSHSGAWRGVLAESEEQPYLVASLHGVCERLGGVTRRWRFDRMSTVCHPESGDLTASFAEVAKYYGVGRGRLPVAAGLAQGRGGEGEPLRGPAVVADAARRRDPSAGPGPAGRLVPPDGRRPAAGPGRGADDGRRADGRRAARPAAAGPVPRRPGGHQGGVGAGAGGLARELLLRPARPRRAEGDRPAPARQPGDRTSSRQRGRC